MIHDETPLKRSRRGVLSHETDATNQINPRVYSTTSPLWFGRKRWTHSPTMMMMKIKAMTPITIIIFKFFHQNFRFSLPACCSNCDAPCCRASASTGHQKVTKSQSSFPARRPKKKEKEKHRPPVMALPKTDDQGRTRSFSNSYG